MIFLRTCYLSHFSANMINIMKQLYIWIFLFVVLLALSFNSRILVADKGMDITIGSPEENIISNRTITVTMHEPELLQSLSISKANMPLERSLLKNNESQNYGAGSMPLAPMPTETPSSSSENNNSGLFSFDTPKENNNKQNWGWIADEVNSADNYRDITPTRKTSGGIFKDSDSQTSSGYERESFFDNTLYGSEKGNTFLDGYNPGSDSAKKSTASPYSTMSW